MLTITLSRIDDPTGIYWDATSPDALHNNVQIVLSDMSPGLALHALFYHMPAWDPLLDVLAYRPSESRIIVACQSFAGEPLYVPAVAFFAGIAANLMMMMQHGPPAPESSIQAGDAVWLCPDCKGTGEYVGLVCREKCTRCAGQRVIKAG